MAEENQLTELWCQFARITKAEDDDNARIVYGLVSDTHTDMDKQRCDGPWLRSSLTKWFDEWGNIRAMHQPIAAGRAVALVEEQPDEWYLTSRIVDPDSVKKVDEGVYKGYSINVAWPKLKRDPKGEAPLGLICGGDIVETSLVDRPSRSAAKIALVKAAGLDAETEIQSSFREAWEAGDFTKAMNIVKKAKDDQVPTSYSDSDEGTANNNPEDTETGVSGAQPPPTEERPRAAKKVAEGDGTCLDCDCSDCDASDPDCGCCDECGSNNTEKAAKGNGRKSPPKGYPKDKSQYAGPSSYAFPVDTAKRTHSAISYYNAGAGKKNHSDSEWTSIGRKIAAAANKFFGGGYKYSDGKIETPSSKKIAETRQSIQNRLSAQFNLLKGDPNPEQIDVFKLLNAGEMSDSELALVSADLIRTLMIRELYEQAEPDESMASVLGRLSSIYDTLMAIAREEYEEAFEYQAAATISQLLTGHTLDQTLEDVQLAKMGASLSKSNQALISNAHHALAMCMKGADCDAYMKLAGAAGAAVPQETKMADGNDESANNTELEEGNAPGEVRGDSNSETPENTETPAATEPEPTNELTELVKSLRAEFDTKVDTLTKAWTDEKEALTKELEELRNRAAEDGPLVTAVTKAIHGNKTASALAEKKTQMTKAWDGARNRLDPELRTADLRDYLRLREEIKVLQESAKE